MSIQVTQVLILSISSWGAVYSESIPSASLSQNAVVGFAVRLVAAATSTRLEVLKSAPVGVVETPRGSVVSSREPVRSDMALVARRAARLMSPGSVSRLRRYPSRTSLDWSSCCVEEECPSISGHRIIWCPLGSTRCLLILFDVGLRAWLVASRT